MSGGVDSSVSAHILQKQGYEVYGVFISIHTPSHIPCSSPQDKLDALRACAALTIPFFSFDATAVYEKEVIRPFVEAYCRGETPNPDVLCNTHVKFNALYTFLLKKGFTRFATGHYALTREVDGRIRLWRSADGDKDQTYFIYTIPQKVLDRILFPVGGLTKREVRTYASRAGLPAAGKRDSVGLCFLGDISMRDFLSAYIKPKPGEVRLLSGECIGTHDGAWLYTEGQRHGFAVSVRGPFVVVRKDIAANTLFVAHVSEVSAGSEQYTLVGTVFRRAPDGLLYARCRHRGDLYPVTFDAERNVVRFSEPQVVAPGQSIVLYTDDGECVGGGVRNGILH